MDKQLIISVGREFGSGGHAIAEELSKRFGIKLYDNNLLLEIAEKNGSDAEIIQKFDEAPKLRILSRTVRGYNNSPEDVISQLQFDYMRELAQNGESFVIVGRCAETVLKGHPALVSIFVLGDYETKLARISEKYSLSQKEAKSLIKTTDKKRKSYHNYHCELHWGDSRLYEVSINSSKLGIDETVDILEAYINKRIGK
ncbi:MAG: cytidylate kinase-like family protein [Clostridiales bacterium]|nr:cytidylate kinase-like family protein [Clostridiales bacterium]